MSAAPAAPTDLRRYLIALLSLTLVQVIATMGFNQASVLAPAAAPELGVAAADVAYYVSIVYLAAMISTVGGGTLTRRLGPIRFIQAGLTVAALGSFVFATGGVAMAALSAFIVGLGSGPLTIASSHILARVSPPRLANVTFSLKQSGVPVGFAICGAVLPTLALDFGWRWAAASVGVLSIATAIAVQPLRALYDDERSGGKGTRLPTLSEIFEPLQLAWRDPILRPMCFIGMLFSATQAIVVNFTVVYAVDGLQMSYVLAGALLSAATIAGAFGPPARSMSYAWSWAAPPSAGTASSSPRAPHGHRQGALPSSPAPRSFSCSSVPFCHPSSSAQCSPSQMSTRPAICCWPRAWLPPRSSSPAPQCAER